ncbi:MAG: exonuclease domain-containing protein [Parcubacteria group bacterium]|jgi:DNA polymerase III epsilon subunit-like protein
MDKSNLVFLDTETTGLGKEDRLCQVAYKFQGQENESLFKPIIPIGIEAMSVAHITNKMVVDKENFSDSKMFTDLKNIFEKDNILVAHNALFDAEILRRESLIVNKIIDTFKIACFFDTEGIIPRYNLQYLRYYFEFDIPDAPAHNALGDIRVLEAIFDYYFEKMLSLKNDEHEAISEMIKISAQPVLIKKFNFGKYSGERIEEVAKKDVGYLKWLLGEKNKAQENGEDEDENWIYTLRHYLNEKPTLF